MEMTLFNDRVMTINISENDCNDARQLNELENIDTPVIWDDDGYCTDTHHLSLIRRHGYGFNRLP